MATTLIALYEDMATATDVIDALQAEGYPATNISLITNDAVGEYRQYLEHLDLDRGDDDVTPREGVTAGAILGGLVGLGVAIIPGIGPVLAAGPLAALLAGGVVGAATGAATGGIAAALMNLNLSEDEAAEYAEGVRRGGTLVVVNVADGDLVDRAETIMEDHDPIDIEQRSRDWRESGWTGYEPETAPLAVGTEHRERPSYELHDVDYAEPVGGESPAVRQAEAAEGFEANELHFRQHYDKNYAATGASYDRYRPAYQYGYMLATRPEYRQRDWSQIETEAQADWEEQSHHGAWQDVKGAVREGWERLKQSV